MKKLLLLGALALTSIAANAQEFEVGDKKMSLTVGAGLVEWADKGRTTFDQHFNMEWGIANISDKFTIGVGFAANNAYGGSVESYVTGSYNYKYTVYYTTKTKNEHNRWVNGSSTETRHRKGEGYATCDEAVEHYNAMATASFHYSPMRKLDTYAKFGIGVGGMSYLLTNYRDENGFSKADIDITPIETSSRVSTTKYSYNDLDHADWDGVKSKVVPAVAFYVGATYYFTPNWGAEAQFGLVSSNIKGVSHGHPSSYSIIAVGAAYKF